jgi:DUF438 domain-containing protein
MNKLTPQTPINDLVEKYPFLVDFLASKNPKFGLLGSKIMRATLGRVATLENAASIGLLEAVRDRVERETGQRLEVDTGAASPEGDEAAAAGRESAAAMKKIILDLHDGLDQGEARQRFDRIVGNAPPGRIAAMEEQLIRDGMPASEIQRLCDLHVGVFRSSLDRGGEAGAPPGHPVHTFMAENRKITELAERLGRLVGELGDPPSQTALVKAWPGLEETLQELRGIESHYVRKENQLFPFLEKHGITGPPKVMWGVHDEIRGLLRAAAAALEEKRLQDLARAGAALARALVDMVYKENRILFPLALETLTAGEWAEARRGEDELGYGLAAPAATWPVAGSAKEPGSEASPDLLDLRTGRLTPRQIDLVLRHLPVDLSFVDEKGHVAYYSDGPARIFPRSPAVIGRHVTNCHPPRSVDKVKEILAAFEKGEQDSAGFWIQMGGRFIYIRYFAVRDDDGTYAGTLEVSQDVTDIKKLEGERRLVQWHGRG